MYYVILNIINIYMLHCWNVLFGEICFNEEKLPVTLLSFPLPSLKSLVDMCYFFSV